RWRSSCLPLRSPYSKSRFHERTGSSPGIRQRLPRTAAFGSFNCYTANDHCFLGPVALGIFGVVAHRQRKDPARHIQAAAHLAKHGEIPVQERSFVERHEKAAGGAVGFFAVTGGYGACLKRFLAEFGFQPVADAAIA